MSRGAEVPLFQKAEAKKYVSRWSSVLVFGCRGAGVWPNGQGSGPCGLGLPGFKSQPLHLVAGVLTSTIEQSEDSTFRARLEGCYPSLCIWLQSIVFGDYMSEVGVLDKYGIYVVPIILGLVAYLMFFQPPTKVDVSGYVQGGLTWGDPSAKNVLLEFSDFQCPYCARFHTDVVSSLENDIKAGKLYFVFKDFPLPSHQYSRPVAYLVRCVYDKNKWAAFDFISWIYSNQQVWEQNPGLVKQKAQDFANVDPDACLNDSEIQSQVSKNYNDGVNLDVSGTPTIFVNGTKFVGYVPLATIQGAFNENN